MAVRASRGWSAPLRGSFLSWSLTGVQGTAPLQIRSLSRQAAGHRLEDERVLGESVPKVRRPQLLTPEQAAGVTAAEPTHSGGPEGVTSPCPAPAISWTLGHRASERHPLPTPELSLPRSFWKVLKRLKTH